MKPMIEGNLREIQQEVQRRLRGAEQQGNLIPLEPHKRQLAEGMVAKTYGWGISVVGYPEQKAEVFVMRDRKRIIVKADDQEVRIKGRKSGPDVLVEGENNSLKGGGKRKVLGFGNLKSVSGSGGIEIRVFGDAEEVHARGEGTSLEVTGSVAEAYVVYNAKVTLDGSTQIARAYVGGTIDDYGEVGKMREAENGKVRIFRQ